jgi:O-acetyl-ADP-ribose deacetylase (regulator of RNase III)
LGTFLMPVETRIGKTTLRLLTGDIADQETDAVVTAAHYRLNKGAGTDGTIHTKGGSKIYEECRRIGGCPIGDAVITTAGNLKARHVIHAVGPVWRGGEEGEAESGGMKRFKIQHPNLRKTASLVGDSGVWSLELLWC